MTDSFVLSAIGLIVTIGGGAITHLYVLMFRLQEKSDQATASRFKEVAELIQRMAERIDKERDALAETRMNMATKNDLREQTRDIMAQIDRRVAWTKAPGHAQLNEG